MTGKIQRRFANNEVEMLGNRKRKRGDDSGHRHVSAMVNGFGFSRNAFLFASVFALLMFAEPASAAWLSQRQSTTPIRTCQRDSFHSVRSNQRLYGKPQPQRESEAKNSKDKAAIELSFLEEEIGDDLDSLRAHAAKLRREAESLETAMEQQKEAKIQKAINKVDGWIDDLLIEVTLGDGTELLKTVDQVYETLAEKRYSAHHVLKIFDRLCDLRESESRSNCSPLMELLVDATGKLDCVEREDNPNKRWNHKVERVLRRKLFARDWNIDYVSEDEKHWF